MALFGKKKQDPKKVQNSIGNTMLNPIPFPMSPWNTAGVQGPNTLFQNIRTFLISKTWTNLAWLYASNGIVKTFVDAPVDDGFSKNFNIICQELDEDQHKALKNWWAKHDLTNILTKTFKWNRLYGGAGIIIDVEGQDPAKPFSVRSINRKSRIRFIDASMWELFTGAMSYDALPEGLDAGFRVFPVNSFNYYTQTVDVSRVRLLTGQPAPDIVRRQLRGFGLSVVEAVIAALNQFFKARDANYEVISECKIDVYKLNSLAYSLFTAQGLESVKERFDFMNATKSYLNGIVIGAEDDFEQKTLSFAGLSDVMQEIRIQLASELGIPELRLFGSSSTNTWNKGDATQENYFNMVAGTVQEPAKQIMVELIKIGCRNLFGAEPQEIDIEFESLKALDEFDEQKIKSMELDRILKASEMGIISPLDAKKMINKRNLLPISVLETDEVFDAISGLKHSETEKIDYSDEKIEKRQEQKEEAK